MVVSEKRSLKNHNLMEPCVALRVIGLVAAAVLFGLFTLCMMCDQYSVILTGTTQIDRMKGEAVENLGIREVFGGATAKFNWYWLVPVEIWFPSYVLCFYDCLEITICSLGLLNFNCWVMFWKRNWINQMRNILTLIVFFLQLLKRTRPL